MTKPKSRVCTGSRKTPPRKAAAILEELAARGVNKKTLAHALGCSYPLLNVWLEKYPKLQDAIDRGRESEHQKLHGALLDSAIKGNVTSAIFLLKTRHGYREGDQGDQANRVSINFQLPGAMKLEDFTKDITPQRKEVDHEPDY